MSQAIRFASIVFVAGLALLLYNYLRFGDPREALFGAKQVHVGVSPQRYCGFAY